MFKKLFFLCSIFINLPIVITAFDSTAPLNPDLTYEKKIAKEIRLKKKLEAIVQDDEFEIPIEEQKQKIRKIHEKLKKMGEKHLSLLENIAATELKIPSSETNETTFYKIHPGILHRTIPEILEFLIVELGYPTKNALMHSLTQLHDLYLTPNVVKNLQILKQYSTLTELENKKIIKLLHYQKLYECKKTIRWSPIQRKSAKYNRDCIASKEIEKIFKPKHQDDNQ